MHTQGYWPILLFCCTLLLSGCVTRRTVVVRQNAPRDRVVVVPASPAPPAYGRRRIFVRERRAPAVIVQPAPRVTVIEEKAAPRHGYKSAGREKGKGGKGKGRGSNKE